MSKTNLGVITELRADRSLLNPSFDHYLLANRSSVLRKIELPNGGKILFTLNYNQNVHLAYFSSPSSKQFGFQHATLYSRVERLVLDLFNSSSNEDHLYTFVENGSLMKLVYKPTVSFKSLI